MDEVYLGLGANLHDPVFQIQTALQELQQLPGVHLLTASPLYQSPPLGPPDQPEYVNAVAALQVELSPYQLLDATQELERRHGRQREKMRRWGPRPLDLDILLYGDRQMEDERLRIPHPGITQRAFVYYPLWKIAPQLRIPGFGPVKRLLIDGALPADLTEIA